MSLIVLAFGGLTILSVTCGVIGIIIQPKTQHKQKRPQLCRGCKFIKESWSTKDGDCKACRASFNLHAYDVFNNEW